MPARARAGRRGARQPTRHLEHRDWLTLTALAEADPDNAVADQLLAAADSVQQLSLRNQLALLVQAGEKNLLLRDIDTEAGWARRGRAVRGPGLRIICPFDPPTTDHTPRRYYRATARWDFTQTDLLGGTTNPQTTPNPPGDPATFVQHLSSQIQQSGFTVGPGPETGVDTHRRLVTIDEPVWHAHPEGTARVLITVLAQLIVGDRDAIEAAWTDRRTRGNSTQAGQRSLSIAPGAAAPEHRARDRHRAAEAS